MMINLSSCLSLFVKTRDTVQNKMAKLSSYEKCNSNSVRVAKVVYKLYKLFASSFIIMNRFQKCSILSVNLIM